MTPTSAIVNKVGKYLYRNIDGREKIKFTGNTCDIYFTVYYQGAEDVDIQMMLININVTTYCNKIRVNTITMTPEERTLGFDLYMPDECQNIPVICEKIYNKVCQRISKSFKEFDFLF